MVWSNPEAKRYQVTGGRQGAKTRDFGLRVIYVLLHQVDLALTVFAVSCGATELNPLMRILLDAPLQLAVFKVGVPLLIAWLLPGRLLLPASALLSLIVCWNIKELLLLCL